MLLPLWASSQWRRGSKSSSEAASETALSALRPIVRMEGEMKNGDIGPAAYGIDRVSVI